MLCVIQQLNVRKCNECGQPLPESFEPLADEPWTTGIFGCSEDRDSCKLICHPPPNIFNMAWSSCIADHARSENLILFMAKRSSYCCFFLYRLDRTILPMCFVWSKCWKLKRRYPLDHTLHLSCSLHWRWDGCGSSNGSHPRYWTKYFISYLWGPIVCLVDVWYIHRSCSAIIAKEISSKGK